MDYKDVNDYELLYLIEEENDDARELLYKKYLPMLKIIAVKYYGYLKFYGVEYDDLFQEAFLAFLKTIKLFKKEEDTLFYTFLRININSKLSNYARVATSKKNLFNYKMLSLNSSLLCDSSLTLADCIKDENQKDFSLILEHDDILNQLKEFNLKLNPLHSQIFELLCSGFISKEIAILLDIDVKDISNILYRIRKRLKKYLASSQ